MTASKNRTPEQKLERWLQLSRIQKQAHYSPGEIQRILNLSHGRFRHLCNIYEETGGLSGLKPSREEGSTHRKIEHDDLVDYIDRRDQQLRAHP